MADDSGVVARCQRRPTSVASPHVAGRASVADAGQKDQADRVSVTSNARPKGWPARNRRARTAGTAMP
jgi:hypothetical protein